MAATLKQQESAPALYPPRPADLSEAAARLQPDAIWQRIEAYICHRFTPRAVVWIVEGSGDWQPPLVPAALETLEIWRDGGWTEFTANASPFGGYEFPGDGPYRITATVGESADGLAPLMVQAAYRRLAEYLADSTAEISAAASYSLDVGGVQVAYERSPSWLARAMQLSGAADLLRQYRRPT